MKFKPNTMRFLLIPLLLTMLTFQTTARSMTHFEQETGDSLTLDNYITSQRIKAERTREGLFFTVHTEGVGKEPQKGDYVKIRYVGKLLNGKKFDESPKNEPFAFQIGKQQVIEGWDIALQKIRVGSKITLYVPAKFGYGVAGIGDAIPPNTPLVYDIELLDVLTAPQYDAHLRSVENAEKRVFMARIAEQLLIDQRSIADYALMHRLKIKRTASGISYVVTKEGKGENAKSSSKITLNYDGMLLNDRVFDTTKDREPFTFTLGEGRTILGWEEGLQQFSEGSEGYLLIPSKFGYGSNPLDDGKIVMGGNSVLVFKIQVLSVK